MKKICAALVLIMAANIYAADSNSPKVKTAERDMLGRLNILPISTDPTRFACELNHWPMYMGQGEKYGGVPQRKPGFFAAIMESTQAIAISDELNPLGLCRKLAVDIAYAANESSNYDSSDLPNLLYEVMAEIDSGYATQVALSRPGPAIKKVALLLGIKNWDDPSNPAWKVVVGYGEKQEDQANYLPQLTEFITVDPADMPLALGLRDSNYEDRAPVVSWDAQK